MKKSLLYLFALICSMGIFTSCSDDDELTMSQVIETELAGTYEGKLGISVNGSELAKDIAQNISLSKSTTENAVKLELKNFTFMGMTLGDIVVDPCTVTESNGTYTFKGAQTLTLSLVGSCPVEVSGTINGKNIDIDIAVEATALQQTVDVTFVGTKAN